jgi:hypothetical protein
MAETGLRLGWNIAVNSPGSLLAWADGVWMLDAGAGEVALDV